MTLWWIDRNWSKFIAISNFEMICLHYSRHSKQMITEIYDSQMQHVTSTRTGVRCDYLLFIFCRNETMKQVFINFILWFHFDRYQFDCWSSAKRMYWTCCLLWWWWSTVRPSQSLHQFGKKSSPFIKKIFISKKIKWI